MCTGAMIWPGPHWPRVSLDQEDTAHLKPTPGYTGFSTSKLQKLFLNQADEVWSAGEPLNRSWWLSVGNFGGNTWVSCGEREATYRRCWLLVLLAFLTAVRASVTADGCLWYHLEVAAKWSQWHRANQLAPADSNWHAFICTLHACLKCFLYNTVTVWCKYGDVPSKYCQRQIKEDWAWMTRTQKETLLCSGRLSHQSTFKSFSLYHSVTVVQGFWWSPESANVRSHAQLHIDASTTLPSKGQSPSLHGLERELWFSESVLLIMHLCILV